MTPEESAALISPVKQFKFAFCALSNKTGFNVFENDEPEAGQRAAHVHFYMLGRSIRLV